MSSKSFSAMIDTFLRLSARLIAHFLPVDREGLPNDLNDNFMVKRELSMIAGGLSLKYERLMAAASLALITVKNLNSRICEDAKLERLTELESRTCEEL